MRSPRNRAVLIADQHSPADVYLRRWRIVSTPWFTVKIHQILRSDDERRGYHNHPWSFVSLRLSGAYTEYRLRPDGSRTTLSRRCSFVHHSEMHRIELGPSNKPVWSLVVTGPRRVSWGFVSAYGTAWLEWRDAGARPPSQVLEQVDRSVQ
jgi:hypothetical protein